MTERKVALITGASSGIGKALCHQFARNDYDLVITARRESLLSELKSAIESEHRVSVNTIPLDLADPESPKKIAEYTGQLGLFVEVLVNNAGYGLPGKFADTQWSDQQALIQVLATAPAELNHYYLPDMLARGRGRILNVASIGAYFPGSPHMTLYGALKHFVLVMSQSLSEETRGSGVTVTALCPGPTETEWVDGSGSRGLFDKLPKGLILSADDVAEIAYQSLMAGKLSVTTGLGSKISKFFLTILPAAIPLRVLSRQYSEH